jgi:hypothetical protein
VKEAPWVNPELVNAGLVAFMHESKHYLHGGAKQRPLGHHLHGADTAAKLSGIFVDYPH